MATNPPPDTMLQPLSGPSRPLIQYLTTFHLMLVVLDPFTNESAWLLETAARVLATFRESDCRTAWLVAGTAEQCRAFLGPHAAAVLTFADPDRLVIKALGLQRLPALVALGMDATLLGAAEGWEPAAWYSLTEELATLLGWKGPHLPGPGDPASYAGSPATG